MTRRWKWDFEDESAEHMARPSLAGSQGSNSATHAHFRRRRGAAAVVVTGLLIVIVVALTGSHHRAPAASPEAAAVRAAVLRASSPSESERHANAAVTSVLAYTPFVREGGGQGRDIALTFDDGPGPYTPEVLSVLERLKVRATFFAIGKMERYFSASTIREVRD